MSMHAQFMRDWILLHPNCTKAKLFLIDLMLYKKTSSYSSRNAV